MLFNKNIELGKLQEKASSPLVVFVFICIFIIVGLLYIMQKSVAVASNLSLSGKYETIQ
jgi:Cu/Ag efflux pump CusA